MKVNLEGSLILEDHCWEWTGATFRVGYGNFRTPRGDDWSDWYNIGAHRWAWEQASGPIPDGLYLLHRCDNPPCVRPSHMFIGTQKANVNDMIQKGRQGDKRNFGTKNGSAKLVDDEVRYIRKHYVPASGRGAKDGNAPELADLFGVTLQAIHAIGKRRIWKNLPD
jgi:hypothetical protein